MRPGPTAPYMPDEVVPAGAPIHRRDLASPNLAAPPRRTAWGHTSSFGVGKREGHDSSAFYARRLNAVTADTGAEAVESEVVDAIFVTSAEGMTELASNSVALMVTSPPYHVGKDYDTDASFEDYMAMLTRVFAEVLRARAGRPGRGERGQSRPPPLPAAVTPRYPEDARPRVPDAGRDHLAESTRSQRELPGEAGGPPPTRW